MKEDLELRINFLSVDNKIARNSHGVFFKIGDIVKHESEEDDLATIQGFKIDKRSNEVKVFTTRGHCHLDFLYHNK